MADSFLNVEPRRFKPISVPGLPDEAREPRRLRGVFATLLLGLVAWVILTMLLAGVREHHG